MSAHLSKSKKTPRYAAPAVDHMLDIVEFLAGQTRPFGVTELSRTLGISTNSVFRILRRLAERGYAEIEPESGTYRLGPRFFSLGMSLASRFDLRTRARRHLEWLAEESGQTAQMQVVNGDRLLILDVANATAPFFLQTQPGSRVHYHGNAFGKCLLAFLDEERRRELLPLPWPRLTKNTPRDWVHLDAELETVRQRGLGYDREEYLRGVSCIGAPVFDVCGEAVAGIGITFLMSGESTPQHRDWERLVLQAAAKIAGDIGYAGDFYSSKQTGRLLVS